MPHSYGYSSTSPMASILKPQHLQGAYFFGGHACNNTKWLNIFVTTDPFATTEPSPTLTPFNIVTLAPMKTLFPIFTSKHS